LIPERNNRNNSRIIINPIEDCLMAAGRTYLDMVRRNIDSGSKNKQFALFLELLEGREKDGDHFDYPDREEIPDEQLEDSDTLTEGQTVSLVGMVLKTLEARRNARY
jgi:hypothetical protein